jgi:hypothetical protein
MQLLSIGKSRVRHGEDTDGRSLWERGKWAQTRAKVKQAGRGTLRVSCAFESSMVVGTGAPEGVCDGGELAACPHVATNPGVRCAMRSERRLRRHSTARRLTTSAL